MTGFLAVALALIVAAAAAIVVPLIRDKERPAPVAGVLTALAVPVAAILLYAMVSSYPWRAGMTPSTVAQEEVPSQNGNVAELSAAEAAARARPDDQGAWLALGEAYVDANRFSDAMTAYTRADSIAGGTSPDAKLGMAEAAILADRDAARGRSGDMVEEVLKLAPDSPKALWYGGMVAMARNDIAGAKARWRRLLELSPPQPVRHVLEQQLARLDAGSGTATGTGDGSPQPVAKPAGAPAGGGAIVVEISVAEQLRSQVKAESPLFLIARDPGRPGPPVAVVRRSAGDLPLKLEISDANVMVPGQSLAALPQVRLTARISARGEPIAAPGDLYGEAVWTLASKGLKIRIDKVVGSP